MERLIKTFKYRWEVKKRKVYRKRHEKRDNKQRMIEKKKKKSKGG